MWSSQLMVLAAIDETYSDIGGAELGVQICGFLVLPFGEGNGNPLQYSCLGDPMDRGT